MFDTILNTFPAGTSHIMNISASISNITEAEKIQMPFHVSRYRILNAKMNVAEDILYEPLKVFWFAGLHPAKMNSVMTKILVLFYISGALFISTLAVQGTLIFAKTDLFFMAECLQTSILMLHGFGKVTSVYCHRNSILKLINMHSKFWEVKSFNYRIRNECMTLHRTVRSIVHRYFCITAVCMIFFLYKPPACYIPEGWLLFVTVYNAFISYGLALSVVATDGFFCVLGVSIIVQFKLLSHRFQNSYFLLRKNKMEERRTLTELVDYHNFLISYCELTNRVFGASFFIQFLASNSSAAISSFILTQGASWNNTLKFVLFCIILILQTSFYCLPADFIEKSIDGITSEIYKSNWYESDDIQFEKSLLTVLIRSQKNFRFSAFGLVMINLKTLIQISKTAFSFYTYLSSVKKIK